MLTCMQRHDGFTFKGGSTQYALFRAEFAKATTCYLHRPAQKLDVLVRMLVEPAKTVIMDCCSISDRNMALTTVWDTLHDIYSYTATNVPSQLANISNNGAVKMSEAGLRELVMDLYACQAKASIHDPRVLDNESFLYTFAKRLPLLL